HVEPRTVSFQDVLGNRRCQGERVGLAAVGVPLRVPGLLPASEDGLIELVLLVELFQVRAQAGEVNAELAFLEGVPDFPLGAKRSLEAVEVLAGGQVGVEDEQAFERIEEE